MMRIIFFDFDGTLTQEKSSWYFIHKNLGIENEAKNNRDAFFRGDISYRDWTKNDAKMWKGIPLKKIEKIGNSIPLNPGAKETIETLISFGLHIVIISSCVYNLADRVSRDLGIDLTIANSLFSENGLVTGEIEVNVTENNKHLLLEEIANISGINPDLCIAVGDSWVDSEMIKKAGMGIAFNASNDPIKECADVVVDGPDLTLIIPHVSEWIHGKPFLKI